MEPLAASDPVQVGVYRLRYRLGAGGMGQVFLGFSPAGRAVAVKIVHPRFARDPEFRLRFALEVRAAEAVSGAYTAPVVGAGPDDDPPWLATAFVPGPSLAEVVAGVGPLPEAAVWRLAGGLIEALQAVHARGLVHRDLKPANVLLAADGPRVIDFGISRALDGTIATAAGMIVGTPAFMSPEQARGNPVGPPGDVFALGSVIAFAATGTTPFGDGEAIAMTYRIVRADPDLTGVPVRLRSLVASCLAKEPGDRPSLAALLGTVATGSANYPGFSPESFWPEPVAGLMSSRLARLDAQLPSGLPSGPMDHEPTTPALAGHDARDLTLTGYRGRTDPPAFAPTPPAEATTADRSSSPRRKQLLIGAATVVAAGAVAALVTLALLPRSPAQKPAAGASASSVRTVHTHATTADTHAPSRSPSSSPSASRTVVVAVTTALVCTQPADSCSGSGGRPYMEAKPAKVVNSGDGTAVVQNITWSGWGNPTSIGTGTLELDSCNPSCANGHYTGYPATVTLTGLSAYGSVSAYATMVISAPTAPQTRFAYDGLIP